MPNKTPASVFLAAMGLLAAVLPGCKSPQPPAREAPKVTVARPDQREQVTDYAEFTGTTKSMQTLEVRARVEGELMSVKKYAQRLAERLRSQTKLEPLSKIRAYQDPQSNPPPADAVNSLVASIRESGLQQPIVVDANYVIICGQTRYVAALQSKLEQVPVYVAKDLTAEQIRAYRVADVKNTELTDWYYNVLKTWKFDLDDFTEGAVVAKGTLLFVIEPDPYRAKLAEAEARLKQSEASRDLARQNYDRSLRLFQKNTITKQEHDTRTAQFDAAEADVLRAQADVRQAQIDLGYTEICAPFEGRIGRRLVDLGNLVGAGEATLLTTIEKTGPMYAYFDINERIANQIQRWRKDRAGRPDEDAQFPVELGLMDEKGYPHKGFLDFVDNAIDPSTGTKLVRGVFLNEDGLISPGAFVRLRVPGQPIPNALLVEEEAICTDLEGKYLWIVDAENVAHKRHVERGSLVDGMRVILKGIGPEDRYVVKGLQHVRNKMPVEPIEAEKPEAAGSARPEADQQEPAPASKPGE